MSKKKYLYTIGHSVHPIEEFIHILQNYEVDLLIDIRQYPGSRYCPQFKKERLKKSLEKVGIEYLHMESLGGRRTKKNDSEENAGWKNSAFRGYADYMQTKEFKKSLVELLEMAKKKTTVIMCAEALPWRCHRSLVGDALVVRGFTVLDIMNAHKILPHRLTSFAHVYRKKITYPYSLEEERKRIA